MTGYPSSYFVALNHLIRYGAWKRTVLVRSHCARALRDLRKRFDRDRCWRERNHMRRICGRFPAKPTSVLWSEDCR